MGGFRLLSIILAIMVLVIRSSFTDNSNGSKLRCPNISRCKCDFKRRGVTCSNVTSVPEIPPWIRKVELQDGYNKYNISLSGANSIPNTVTNLTLTKYKMLTIEGDAFAIGSMLTELTLGINSKTTLTADVFKNVRGLTNLVIHDSNVRRFHEGILKNLQLKSLCLGFLGTDALTEDDIVRAVCSLDFIHLRFLDLTAMGLKRVPRALVRCLPSLTGLVLTMNWFVEPGTLSALSALRNLNNITLMAAMIKRAETLNFIRGKNLAYFDITGNGLSPAEVRKIFCYLGSRSEMEINVSGNEIGFVDEDFFGCLVKAKFSSLCLAATKITGIELNAFREVPNMTRLDLEHNQLPSTGMGFLTSLKNLNSLVLSFNGLSKFPRFTTSDGTCIENMLKSLDLIGNHIEKLGPGAMECLGSLERLDLGANDLAHLEDKTFNGLTRLKTLILDYNKLKHLGSEPFPLNLVELNLESNLLNSLSIQGLKKLQKLRVSNIFLRGSDFNNKANLELLYVRKSTVLQNELSNVLKRASSLKSLELHDVPSIRSVPEEILHLDHLKNLVVTSAAIKVIPARFVTKLSHLDSFDLSNNPFECSCDLVSFAVWLGDSTRRTMVGNLDDTLCFSPKKCENTKVMDFQLDCRSLLPIVLPSVLAPTLFLIIVSTVVSVRYRGYIRYGCMLVRARWKGYGAMEGRSFKYDTFVSYNREDAAWVLSVLRPKLEDETGYQICLHDRDFTAGEDIVDNIITSIDESRKTILVLSDNFAQSQWCQLEMSLAQHKLFEDNRDVVILVRVGEVAEENVTKTMRMLMRTKTYITWPEDEGGIDLFWRNLIFALRRPPGVVMEEPEWPVGGATSTEHSETIVI